MLLQDAHQWYFLCLIEYDICIWLLVNQEKSLLAVDCSCVITLEMSSAQEYGSFSASTCYLRKYNNK